MIVGRVLERQLLESALDQAAQGAAQLLCLVGPPGIGKSTLLDYVTEVGVRRNFTAVGIKGSRTDGVLPGLALHDLRRLLIKAGGLGVGAELNILSAGPPTNQDVLQSGLQLLALLSDACERSPVVITVDDAQWLDGDSMQVLTFVGRRLGPERVVIVLSVHDQEQVPDRSFESLLVSDLSDDESVQVVRQAFPDASAAYALQLTQAIGGNPLALLEATRVLSPTVRVGIDQVPSSYVIPDRVTRSIELQLDQLSDSVGATLLVVACEDSGDVEVVSRALATSGDAQGSLQAAVDAGLLRRGPASLQFRHPLIAATVLSRATPVEVRQVHSVLANALDELGRNSLWHRAAAVTGNDDALAIELVGAAVDALAAGRVDEAHRSSVRAAALALTQPVSIDALLVGLAASVRGGDWEASDELTTRLSDLGTFTLQQRQKFLTLRAQSLLGRGNARDGVQLMIEAAKGAPPASRKALLLEAVDVSIVRGEPDLTADVLRETRHSLSDHDTEFARLYTAAMDAGEGRSVETMSDMRACISTAPLGANALGCEVIGAVAIEVGEYPAAHRQLSEAMRLRSLSGDVPGLAYDTALLAFSEFSAGRWDSAYVRALSVLDLVDEKQHPSMVVEVLDILSDIDAARGNEASLDWARRLAHAGERTGDHDIEVLSLKREGAFWYAKGDLVRAEERLQQGLREATRLNTVHPYVLPTPELVELLVRQSRRADAFEAAQSFLAAVTTGSPPPARARALRIQALVTDADPEPAYLGSIDFDDSIGMAYQAARTRLLYGEWLRRERRRTDARAVLTGALTVFERLGADPWVARTLTELGAAGSAAEVPPSRNLSQLLSPQELQVAVLAAEGARNKDIAATLFLSVRTVEAHLSRAYRKLGVTNRAQLTRAVQADNSG